MRINLIGSSHALTVSPFSFLLIELKVNKEMNLVISFFFSILTNFFIIKLKAQRNDAINVAPHQIKLDIPFAKLRRIKLERDQAEYRDYISNYLNELEEKEKVIEMDKKQELINLFKSNIPMESPKEAFIQEKDADSIEITREIQQTRQDTRDSNVFDLLPSEIYISENVKETEKQFQEGNSIQKIEKEQEQEKQWHHEQELENVAFSPSITEKVESSHLPFSHSPHLPNQQLPSSYDHQEHFDQEKMDPSMTLQASHEDSLPSFMASQPSNINHEFIFPKDQSSDQNFQSDNLKENHQELEMPLSPSTEMESDSSPSSMSFMNQPYEQEENEIQFQKGYKDDSFFHSQSENIPFSSPSMEESLQVPLSHSMSFGNQSSSFHRGEMEEERISFHEHEQENHFLPNNEHEQNIQHFHQEDEGEEGEEFQTLPKEEWNASPTHENASFSPFNQEEFNMQSSQDDIVDVEGSNHEYNPQTMSKEHYNLESESYEPEMILG